MSDQRVSPPPVDYWDHVKNDSARRLAEFQKARAEARLLEAREDVNATGATSVENVVNAIKVAKEKKAIAENKPLPKKRKTIHIPNETNEINAIPVIDGVLYPVSGVGPSFVVPRLMESKSEYIRRWVAFVHDVDVKEIIGQGRTQKVVKARQHFFYEVRETVGRSLNEIGRMASNRDHTTVLHGIKKHAERHGLEYTKAGPYGIKNKEV